MILCSGCFDGLHVGHVAYLRAARRIMPKGPLAVAVAPDSYVRLHKEAPPKWPEDARMATIAAMRDVDSVFLHGPESVADVIRKERPRYFAKGVDWRDCLPSDVIAACQEAHTEIVFVDSGVPTHNAQPV